MKKIIVLFPVLLMFINAIAQDCNLNDEAKRHWFKAEGMRKAIDNTDDWQLVADEYEKAAQDAPDCPAIYYNLGICYEELGKNQPELCDKAIAYYQKYLQLNPNAKNKGEVEGLIYEVEGKKEVYQKQKNEKLEKWCGKWYFYTLGDCRRRDFTYNVNFPAPDGFYALEIFISQGSLKAKVGASFTVDYSGSTTYEYQVVPVILDNDYISIEYDIKLITPAAAVAVSNYSKNNYNLHLVSPNRMEGENAGISSDGCFYFGKR